VGAAEAAGSVYDAYDTVKTLVDPNAGALEKGAAAGGAMMGAVLPGAGYGVGAKAAVKNADNIVDAAKDIVTAGKNVFSEAKQALVAMAKADKKRGITEADMEAYKALNKELPDPFPANKVRGPETSPTRGPASQKPHGHVGPVNHIPIKKDKNQ
jgi:hypothetical protein